MSEIIIREATLNDAELLLTFIKELAIYEKAEHEVHATIETIKDTMFCDKTHVGSAIYFYNYSTWLAKSGLYLEDLYVTPEYRGIGAGLKLLKTMAKIAIDNDCARFEWSCLDWNKPSRDFYQAIGAVSQDEWVGYRMTGKTLFDFAQS
jgi:GNAT superfamily N-acetyltransferase